MRPLLVVHLQPVDADFAHQLKTRENVCIQHFFPERAVVALDVRVLIGFAGLDVSRLDPVSVAPIEQILGDELRSVIHP